MTRPYTIVGTCIAIVAGGMLMLVVQTYNSEGRHGYLNRENAIDGSNAITGVESAQTQLVGRTLEEDLGFIEGAVVERVALFPREHDDSEKTIERPGILVRYPDAQATVLMCHGFMCDKYDQAFLRRLFPRGRFNVMSFDFRAHGEKLDGQYCTFGRDEALDVIAAARFLKEHPSLSNKPLYVYGFSMGAVAAIEAQARQPGLFNAMILDCPFDSTENIIKRSLDEIKFSFLGYEFGMPGKSILQRYAFHPYVQSFVKATLRAVTSLDPRHVATNFCLVTPAESVKKVDIPSLFIHCKNDKRVPVDAVKTVFERSAASYKVLWLTNGRQHFDSFFYCPEKYTERVRDFLDDALKGTFERAERREIIEDKEEVRGV